MDIAFYLDHQHDCEYVEAPLRMITLIVVLAQVNLNQIILILLQCKPLPAFWDYRIEGADCSFTRTTSRVGFFQGGWGAATDFALAFHP